MNATNEISGRDLLDAVAFAGDVLGPLFLRDPGTAEAPRELLAAFEEIEPAQAAAEWPFGEEAAVRGALALMVEGLASGVSDELVWEYRRLFVGPQTKAAPPWGSVYTDHDRVAFGASERALRRWMRERGVALLSAESDPADHIGLMLSLMAWMAREKPEVLTEYLRLHLLTWAPHFLERVEDVAEHPFYEGLAILARETLDGIRVAFGIEVLYPRFYK